MDYPDSKMIKYRELKLTESDCNYVLGALNFSLDNMPNTAFITWSVCYGVMERIKKQLAESGGGKRR